MRAVLGPAAVAAALAIAVATAADAQTPGGYFWQGPYVGANLGYQWGRTSNNPTRPSGFAGGVQAGYNWQNGRFVYGAETDLQLSGADDTFAPWKFSNPWFGTLRGRGGIALNNILLYATLGLAYGSLRAESATTSATETRTGFGWVTGVGVEVGLTGRWTARTEYLYVDLSDRSYGLTGTSNGLGSSVLRAGVNYRF